MLSEQLVKARLISNDAPSIEFMFNPSEITFEAVMETSESSGAKSKESGKPKVNFSHIKAYKVTISNILFDTYEEGSDVVATYIEPFKRALEFVGQGGETKDQKPPLYTFVWGKRIYLRQCFIENLAYKLTLFLPDGTPVRAIIDQLTLKEVDEEKPSGGGLIKQPTDMLRNVIDNITNRKNK
jgi:hypothetical protein